MSSETRGECDCEMVLRKAWSMVLLLKSTGGVLSFAMIEISEASTVPQQHPFAVSRGQFQSDWGVNPGICSYQMPQMSQNYHNWSLQAQKPYSMSILSQVISYHMTVSRFTAGFGFLSELSFDNRDKASIITLENLASTWFIGGCNAFTSDPRNGACLFAFVFLDEARAALH